MKPFLSSSPPIIKEQRNLEQRRILTENIKRALVKKNGMYYLPEDTILYHGTLDNNFGMHVEEIDPEIPMVYFGLDVEISLWFILEAAQIKDLIAKDLEEHVNHIEFILRLEEEKLNNYIDKLRKRISELSYFNAKKKTVKKTN